MSLSFNFRIFHGSANIVLACKVAKHSNILLGKASVDYSSDGEIHIEIQENVRGRDIFVIQSIMNPTSDHLMEVLFLGDALRRASAGSLIAVMPYFGYARQDRRINSSRVPISAKIIMDMLQKVGYSRLITVDLHSEQIQGFSSIPVDNVYSSTTMFKQHGLIQKYSNPLIVSPNVGGVVRARAIAKHMNHADLAIIDKRRSSSDQTEVINIIGKVQDRNCVIVDDIVDTADTLVHTAQALKEKSAKTVTAFCVHPILSDHAIENIMKSSIDEVVVTDTIPLTQAAKKCPKITSVTLSSLLSKTISRINQKRSVSQLFLN